MSAEHDPSTYLQDIQEAIGKIEKYVLGISFEEFTKNTLISDAVLRNLEIIGEAVKQLPFSLTQQHEEIPWKKIAGFRDITIHAYGSIDFAIVWDIVTNKLPELKQVIITMLQKEKDKTK